MLITGNVFNGVLLVRWVALALGLALGLVRAAEVPRPVVGPGATKDEVIDAYGWPNGQSQSGTKEILTYPQGQITLENGRVEKMEFSPNVPWPTPRPRPGPPTNTTVKKVEAPVDFWITNFDAARTEAERRHSRILALFTGSDWSPPSIKFGKEVEFHSDFVNAFAGDFVFLRLDFPTRAPQPPELRAQNAALRDRYGVTTYPSLLVLAANGALVGQVDLAKSQPGATYREQVINAVREVRDLLVAHPPAPEPAATVPATEANPTSPAPAPEPANSPAAATAAATSELGVTLISARALIIFGVVLGALVAAGALWLVWRKWSAPRADRGAADRISDAASGFPSLAVLSSWPKERVRGLVAALAEADGYVVESRTGTDIDLALRRMGEPQPSVLVCCATGSAGPVSVRRMRELFASLTAEGVAVGWFVAPAGFAAEAQAFAEQNGVLIMDGDRLLGLLRDLPPLILPRVLARKA